MEETGRLLGEIGRIVKSNPELSSYIHSRLRSLLQAVMGSTGDAPAPTLDQGTAFGHVAEASRSTRSDSEMHVVSGLERPPGISSPGDSFDYSIESLLNTKPRAPRSCVRRESAASVDQNEAFKSRGERFPAPSFQYIAEIKKDQLLKMQPEGRVMLMPANPPFVPSGNTMRCVSPAQNDQRIIENSVAWQFIREFFGGNIKFPALLILIEEIRNVQMIPFKKCKNMRKADLIKWLDDHWSVILPFFQALSPDEKARMWMCLNG